MFPIKVKVGVYCRKSNNHGTQARGEKWNEQTVHGWKIQRIHGVRGGYFRLMLYAPSGKCWSLDIYKPTSKPEWSV